MDSFLSSENTHFPPLSSRRRGAHLSLQEREQQVSMPSWFMPATDPLRTCERKAFPRPFASTSALYRPFLPLMLSLFSARQDQSVAMLLCYPEVRGTCSRRPSVQKHQVRSSPTWQWKNSRVYMSNYSDIHISCKMLNKMRKLLRKVVMLCSWFRAYLLCIHCSTVSCTKGVFHE